MKTKLLAVSILFSCAAIAQGLSAANRGLRRRAPSDQRVLPCPARAKAVDLVCLRS